MKTIRRGIEAYDVIQVNSQSPGKSERWEDYSTIRESDLAIAKGMAIRHPTLYRVVSADKTSIINPA